MIDVLQIAANAHKVFLLPVNEKKRRLINLVLSTVKLSGRKLEYTLCPRFDMFVKLPKNEEWRALVDRFRQIYNFRNLIIRLEIGE